jgi:hypothetical protein
VRRDLSIGEPRHDRRRVELSLAGSFTLRVDEPVAVVALARS